MTFPRKVLGPLLTIGLAVAAGACESQSNTSTGPSPVKCLVSLDAPSDSIESSGGKGVIAVTAQPECSWTASSGAAWITLTPTSGQGAGQIEFQATANTAATMRQGSISVNDRQVPVQQRPAPCRFDVSPLAPSVGAEGGTVTVTVATLQGCAWQASGANGWVTIANTSGTGSGTVSLRVAPGGAEARSATLQVAGQTVTLTQSSTSAPGSGAPCAYSLAPSALSLSAAAGGGTLTLTTSTGCPWMAVSQAPWVTVTSPAQGSGPAAVTFTVAANSGAARSGSLAVAGQISTINQAAAGAAVTSCSFALGSNTQSVAAGGAAGVGVNVSTAAGCAWTARSNDGWITLRSGATGTGPGAVTFDVASNAGAARTGTLTIAGATFTVTQATGVCAYSISPTEQAIDEKGGEISVTVSTGAGCAWTAKSDEKWIDVTQGATGTGPGAVHMVVEAGNKKRTGTVKIAGQTFTVLQNP